MIHVRQVKLSPQKLQSEDESQKHHNPFQKLFKSIRKYIYL